MPTNGSWSRILGIAPMPSSPGMNISAITTSKAQPANFSSPGVNAPRAWLSPDENSRAALGDGADAFGIVGGLAQSGLDRELDIGLALHRPRQVRSQCRPGGLDRERRVLGDLPGQGQRRIAQPVERRENICEAPGDGLVAFDAAAGEAHQRRLLRADETGKRVGDAETGMEAELDEIGDETRLGRGDAEIRDQRQAETGADSGALN